MMMGKTFCLSFGHANSEIEDEKLINFSFSVPWPITSCFMFAPNSFFDVFRAKKFCSGKVKALIMKNYFT